MAESFIFQSFGRDYLPLLKVIYRYNNRQRIIPYLRRPDLLTSDLYRVYADPGRWSPEPAAKSWPSRRPASRA